jgi:hypothetical protein
MSTLQLTFQDLYNEVAKFLGTYGSSGPSGADLTDAKNAVHAAYRRFLAPPRGYKWSFLRRKSVLVTNAGVWQYQLPEDFTVHINRFAFDADDFYPTINETDLENIMDMRSHVAYSNYPMFFALYAGEYSKETSQGWEVAFYPTPDAAYSLNYRYLIFPPKLEADTDFHIGGPEMSEVIKALCIAEAEVVKDETGGKQEQRAQQRLAEAVKSDALRHPDSIGYNGPMAGGYENWREGRMGTVTFTTGY